MKLIGILFLGAFLAFPGLVHAADEASAVVGVPQQDPADLERRLELSRQWHKVMPVSVRQQVEAAINDITQGLPENEREVFRANMRSILNYQAIEKISIDAVAEVYSVAELQAMIEYYSKPEAKSAQAKYESYAGKVYPEITRMLDQAVMRVRTGGTGQ